MLEIPRLVETQSILTSPNYRTRDKRKSYLSALSEEQYLDLLNHNIAAFAASMMPAIMRMKPSSPCHSTFK
jgi:hypothetical protein